MAKTPKQATNVKDLQAEIKWLKAENKRLDDVLSVIQTRHSRTLLYDTLTLPEARQVGVNIEALISYAAGDITKAELKKAMKHVR